MESVLISIQPKWCELIASGEKTIEVRKTTPRLKPPFKCYIYETKNTKGVHGFTILGRHRLGTVIGEFICDRIDTIQSEQLPRTDVAYENRKAFYDSLVYTDLTCITYDELSDYVGFGLTKCYGWHISDLKIYDKPRKLEEFKVGKVALSCGYGNYNTYDKVLTCPPQSWRYINE